MMSMYANKYRQKTFYNRHIKNKELQVGDVVLVYKFKEHLGKLQKRGKGPYIINQQSSSGAIKLATLDGTPWTNWINGYRVKKYQAPLFSSFKSLFKVTSV